MRRAVDAVAGSSALLALGLQPPAGAAPPHSAALRVRGLQHTGFLTRDARGITHVSASSLHDVFFLQGWVQTRDRQFQMDVNRRTASGSLAELLGKPALRSDVQLRTLGLRRAAQRSWDAASPQLRSVVLAYTDGVNAYTRSHGLAPEYGALKLAAFAPWTPIDTIAVGKLLAFGLSFDLDVDKTIQLQEYVAALGPQKGAALFSQDVERVQPFTSASTVPDATGPATASAILRNAVATPAEQQQLATAAALARAYAGKVQGVPLLQAARERGGGQGSNEWAVSGRRTVTGRPILANDPHLSLSAPSTFYPIGLHGPGIDAEGEGFAGAPGIVQGHNRYVEWGSTVNPMDVTDTYLEQVQQDPSSPSGLSTTYLGKKEPIQAIPETFRYNTVGSGLGTATSADGVPAATLVVPRRNNGPIIELGGAAGSSLPAGAALSVQYTGFSATQELQTFLIWDMATGLKDFRRGLDYFDFGSQNFAYADRMGNIAYFTSGEMPVREDLQAGTVHGSPPWLIRDGTGGNEWAPITHPQPHQATPYEIYPYAELPQVVNPSNGWFVNANNDPAGTNLDNNPLNQLRVHGGIYYLNAGYDGFRAGRITELLRAKLTHGKVSMGDMAAIQSDTGLVDAEYFVPWIRRAFAGATAAGAPTALAALAADPRVSEAVQRLAAWDFTTPTGVPQGYDAADVNGVLSPPSAAEQARSVAATLYAVWRSAMLRNVIDHHLGALPKPGDQESLWGVKHLLDTWDATHGVGASGIDFFAVPGVTDPAAARDSQLLGSLRDALISLAGPDFAAAFHGSTDQSSYRWGLLHRLTLAHPLGAPFSAPPAFGAFPAPLAGLSGVPVDGGFGTVDAASHDARATTVDGFTFDSGPARRYLGSPTPQPWVPLSALPGGTSGVPGSPYYLNLLRPYLTDDYYAALLPSQVRRTPQNTQRLRP